jgi:hypothetical protein
MATYDLQPNESVLLDSKQVRHGDSSGELVLTNLSLIYVTSKGVFKTTYINQRFPINQIRAFNGKTSVILGKNGNLDIYFMNGQESFRFWNDDMLFSEKKAEKEATKWADAINQLIAGQTPVFDNSVSSAIPDTEFIAETLKDTFNTVKGTFGIKTKTQTEATPEKIAGKCTSCGAPISGAKGQIVRCQYCDTDQQL